MSRKECVFAVLLLSVQAAAQALVPVVQNPAGGQQIIQPPGTTFSTNNEAGILYPVKGLMGQPGPYDWSQSFSGIFNAGQQIVTLSPYPAGILVLSNAAPFTRFWVAGPGGGPSEAAVVTATNCPLQGGTNATITFTIVNNYSNGFTLSSASNGIQEAINAANTVSSNFPDQFGKVIIPPGDYTAKARVSVLGNKQYIDANGAVLTCTIADTCVFVGDTGSANTTWDVTIDGLSRFALDSVEADSPRSKTTASTPRYVASQPGTPPPAAPRSSLSSKLMTIRLRSLRNSIRRGHRAGRTAGQIGVPSRSTVPDHLPPTLACSG